MIKLSQLYNEIKLVNKPNPNKDLLQFLKVYWNEIAEEIEGSTYFDPYDKNITFEKRIDADENNNNEEYEKVIALNDDYCGAASFTTYERDLNKESDEGPFSGWSFIKIRGYTIQYSTSGC